MSSRSSSGGGGSGSGTSSSSSSDLVVGLGLTGGCSRTQQAYSVKFGNIWQPITYTNTMFDLD